MVPLALDSPRWRQLKAHFNNAGDDGDLPSVPRLLARWHDAVGSYREEYDYDPLRESYLHQQTMLDVAYAVVPHVASRLRELDPDRRVEVLEDLALVEGVRVLSPEKVEAAIAAAGTGLDGELREMMIQTARDRLARLPEDLAPAYLEAIKIAKAVGGASWRKKRKDELGPSDWRRHIRYLRESGWTDADIAFAIHALRAERPDGALVYAASHEEARDALARMKRGPKGWLDRTRLRLPEGELGFQAVHTLAWWAALDVDTILA